MKTYTKAELLKLFMDYAEEKEKVAKDFGKKNLPAHMADKHFLIESINLFSIQVFLSRLEE